MKSHYCEAEGTVVEYEGECNWCGEKEMTQDEIIRMAEEAGFKRETTLTYGYPYTAYKANIERFAALVAAHEREKQALAEPELNLNCKSVQKRLATSWGYVKAEQAEQEPVYISESCAERGCACHYSVEVDGEPVAVYSAPVRTKDLTDDEIEAIMVEQGDLRTTAFARAVIAKLREKERLK